MKIPVVKKSEPKKNELTMLDMKEVLYMNIENRSLVYHTLQEQYFHITTLSELEEILGQYGFSMLDKTNLVNMNQVKKLDTKHGKIYFEEEPSKGSKYATVAFIKQKKLKHEIDRAIANNTNKTLEYTQGEDKSEKFSFRLSEKKN